MEPLSKTDRIILLDIIRESLNYLQSHSEDEPECTDYDDFVKSIYTCDALWITVYYRQFHQESQYKSIVRQLAAMISAAGISENPYKEFEDIPEGPQRQQARALWLTWFHLMVKERIV